MMDELQRIHDEYMGALERRERAAVLRLTRAYGDIWKWLKGELDVHLERMEQARLAGDVVGPAWVWTDARLRSLLEQVEAEVGRWARASASIAEALQAEAVTAGGGEVAAQLRAQLPAGVVGEFARLSRGAVEDLVGFTTNGGPLARLFDQLGPQARAEITRALMTGLGAGLHPRKVAADLARRAAGVPLARALTIARTEMLRAYREAGHRTTLANQDVLRGWRWAAALSVRTCGSCVAMHGTWHTLEERLEDHPNGRCSAVYETKTWGELGLSGVRDTRPALPDAETWLRGLSEADQARILGHQGAALWRAGQVALHEFTERRESVEWGGMRTLKPVSRILADKKRRWAGLKNGDVKGLESVMAHYGVYPRWSGRAQVEPALDGTGIEALFDAWPARLPNGKLTRGQRDLLLAPATAADIAMQRGSGVLQALHKLAHAASPGLDREAYTRHRKVEELTCALTSQRLLKPAMADIGAPFTPQRRRMADAFAKRLSRRGLTALQIEQVIEAGLRVPLADRRTMWVYEIADMLGVNLSEARRVLRDSLPRSREF